jgi:hypothetical protein
LAFFTLTESFDVKNAKRPAVLADLWQLRNDFSKVFYGCNILAPGHPRVRVICHRARP